MRFCVLLCLLAIGLFGVAALQEAPDGSVCFNQCSGHGDCIDYSCHCHVGYLGDDCSTTFADEANLVPILTAGHFNLTRKNFTQALAKHPLILVGFSSYSCHKCIAYEPTYLNVSRALAAMKIPFARADVDKLKSFAAEFGALELPNLVLVHKMRPLLYKGVHSEAPILQFVTKQSGPPVKKLDSVSAVEQFFASRQQPSFGLSTVMVVGFFSEHEDVEEDEYDEFMEIAKELQGNEDLYFGVVTKPSISTHYKKNRSIDRTPSVLMQGEDKRHAVNLNELYGEQQGLKEWLLSHSIPLVGKLTHKNFGLYEKIQKPMLLLFLDLADEDRTSQPGRVVGGKSGGILNEVLLEEFRSIAKEYSDRLLFGYLDGNLYEDQMRSLGLYGGKERLPALAFNTRDGVRVPFPETWSINSDTLNQFCAEFLSGKLRSPTDVAVMAQKALQRATSLSTKNAVHRRDMRKAPEVVTGVAEQFGDGKLGDEAIVTITAETFDDWMGNEEKDVVLLLHAQDCLSCAHFAVYFKRMALRLQDLGIPSLVVARMDVTHASPPARYQLLVGALPLMVMLPAGRRSPPWNFYSGVGKVQPMMKWVQAHAAIEFDLPNLPHLTEKDRVLYKEQVRQREEALEQKRKEEKEAMEAEERAQQKYREKKQLEDREKEKEEEREAEQVRMAVAAASGVSLSYDTGEF